MHDTVGTVSEHIGRLRAACGPPALRAHQSASEPGVWNRCYAHVCASRTQIAGLGRATGRRVSEVRSGLSARARQKHRAANPGAHRLEEICSSDTWHLALATARKGPARSWRRGAAGLRHLAAEQSERLRGGFVCWATALQGPVFIHHGGGADFSAPKKQYRVYDQPHSAIILILVTVVLMSR